MKLVKLVFVFMIIALVASCSSLQAPIYKGVADVKVADVVNDSIVIKAALNFNNPNRVGGKMLINQLHAFVNDIDLGNLKSKEVEVPSKEDFSVPLEIKLSYGQIFDSKAGLLGTLFNSVLKNEINVKLNGNATFKKSFLTKDYPIHFSKKIQILK